MCRLPWCQSRWQALRRRTGCWHFAQVVLFDEQTGRRRCVCGERPNFTANTPTPNCIHPMGNFENSLVPARITATRQPWIFDSSQHNVPPDLVWALTAKGMPVPGTAKPRRLRRPLQRQSSKLGAGHCCPASEIFDGRTGDSLSRRAPGGHGQADVELLHLARSKGRIKRG